MPILRTMLVSTPISGRARKRSYIETVLNMDFVVLNQYVYCLLSTPRGSC